MYGGGILSREYTLSEVEQLWKLLDLREGSRILDAPCGYGRLSRPFAGRGACVVGVDLSRHLVEKAETERGELPKERLRYMLHDLRSPLTETGFDAALNIFSSLGYGSEEDDLLILRTLHQALKPGGLLFVDTMHRDAAVAKFSRGEKLGNRLPDGTLVVEESVFDPVEGRIRATWYWSGPDGSGQKSASFRIYTATELVRLLEQAGFQFRSAHAGCSVKPFTAEGPEMGGRLGVLARRSDAEIPIADLT